MTILNRQNDGLYSILLTLTRTVFLNPNMSRDSLIDLCLPHNSENDSRARGTLNRWIELGLFNEEDQAIRLHQELLQGESIESFMARLPGICRTRALARGEPLWPAGDNKRTEEGTGLTADLCRGLAWYLAQDIYTLPSTWNDIDQLVGQQIKPEYIIIMNDTRWTGLRSWARFLGFATGDGDSFFLDPTQAVHAGLQQVIATGQELLGPDCIARLAQHLPVLDGGSYRKQVEDIMLHHQRIRLDPGHLSTALSFALRRLEKQGIIELITRADTGASLTLTGAGQRQWHTFTHIRLVGEIA